MKLEVIIPNYNGSHLLEKNLPSVIESIHKYNAVITIVDDYSQIDDYSHVQNIVKALTNQYKVTFQLLRNEKNLGFSSTVNKAALQSKSDMIVLLNSDVAPLKDFLDTVIPLFEQNDQLFGVGCMDQSIEGEQVVLRGRGIGIFQNGFLIHQKGEVDKETTLWISGGSSIIRTKYFQKLGGFDPLYNPFYWEDIDLSYRALKSGYNLIFTDQSVVEHRHEEGAIKKNFSQFKVSSIAYRNQLFFMWKNVTDTAIIIQHGYWLLIQILRSVMRFDIAFFVGLLSALFHLPYVLIKRNTAKKLFIKTDQEVVEPFKSEYIHGKK